MHEGPYLMHAYGYAQGETQEGNTRCQELIRE